jgi:hypothetical protein
MGDASFKPDLAGIREALSQPGVVAALDAAAKGIAASANSAGLERIRKKYHHGSPPTHAPYRSYTTKGHKYGVALGIVTTASGLGEEDEAENKTLESFNH